jgi:putative membrane protein
VIAVTLVLAAAAAAYALGARRAAGWPWWRSAAWFAGLAALGVALLASDRALAGHMAEHVLLTVVAPPLLVIGGPHALTARHTGRALHRLRLLVWPPFTWALFAAVMLVAHLTGAFDYALDHPWAHGVEHAALFWAAIAFWVPVCAAPPAPRTLRPIPRIAYLLTAMTPMGVIGALLMNAGDPVYSHYSVAAQGDAGAAMWVGGGYVLVLATVAAAWGSLEAEERRQRARERYE